MWIHYLTTLYRALTRHRLYAAINVLGLAIGIAVFLVLSLYVSFETSFERWLPRASSIYVLHTGWIRSGHAVEDDSDTMGGALDELREDYPQVVGSRLSPRGVTVRQGGEISADVLTAVDPSFFQVFDLPLAAGNKADLLRAPDQLLLTQEKAQRYFGSANPIGQRLTLAMGKRVVDYRVAGVLKNLPHNSDLNLDMIAPLTQEMADAQGKAWRHWGSQSLSTYLRFDTPAAADAFADDLDRFVDRHAAGDVGAPVPHNEIRLRAKPLVEEHLADPKDSAAVVTLGAVGLLTLLLAGVNYVNLATARAGLRAKEVALRKTMGATGGALIAQFMLEAVVTAAVATLLGTALCELALPGINAAGGLHLRMVYFGAGSVLPLVVGLVLVLGFGAGAYPALVLSRFRPASVLASAKTPGGGRMGGRVREGLVLLQFAIAIAFTIGTTVILSQADYLRHADLGFKRDGLIVVNAFSSSQLSLDQRTTLLELWRATPGIVSATTADMAPGVDDSTSAQNYTRPGMKGDGPALNYVQTGTDFAKTYDVRLVAGRMLDTEHGLDDSSPPVGSAPDAPKDASPHNVVLNVNGVRALGFANAEDALGKTILEGAGDGARPRTVVGVIDNFRFRSPHKAIPPSVYYLQARPFPRGVAGLRYASTNPAEVMRRLQTSWRQVAPTVPFRAKTIEQSLDTYYRPDDQRGRLFTTGAGLAVLIGCLGLYGLASFNTARRTKEIGIRKTLGASTVDVLRLLLGQFLRPVLLANLIAWPLAYGVMQGWLSGFDQRIALSPLYFVGATVLAVLIAVLTVVGQALKVARAEPAKALRYE